MRGLTQEEIDNAPDWATHYRAIDSEVQYESTTKWMAIGVYFPFIIRGPFSQKSKLTKCKPIPSKSFYISEHEFDGLFYQGGSSYRVDFNIDMESFSLSKDDVIALSKHFKLTEEDLK